MRSTALLVHEPIAEHLRCGPYRELGLAAEQMVTAARRRSSFTVGIAVLDGVEILYVDRVRSFRQGQIRIDLGLRPGSRLPAYCTSMGKVLLAHLPDGEQRELLAHMQLTRRGPHGIMSKRALRAELEQVRSDGYAVNDEELAEGLYSISVPVHGKTGEVVAAVNMAAHALMISLDELVDRLLPLLISTAGQISARLGYRGVGEKRRGA